MSVPPEDRAKKIKGLDLSIDKLPIERALDVHWCIESDAFKFRIELKDKPCTQIPSVRNIMAALMKHHGHSLDDESLQTLLCEVEDVVNSSPLTTKSLSDPHSPLPLTPSTFLNGKTKLILPSPSFKEKIFIASDVGGVHSILQTSSGAGGARKTYIAYKQDKSGHA